MKKYLSVLAVVLVCTCLLTGCSDIVSKYLPDWLTGLVSGGSGIVDLGIESEPVTEGEPELEGEPEVEPEVTTTEAETTTTTEEVTTTTTTTATTTTTSAAAEDHSATLLSVLLGAQPVVSQYNDDWYLPNYLRETYYGAQAVGYAFIDFDEDGNTEMVVETTLSEVPYIVLHYFDGNVYFYEFGVRAMSELKEDGSHYGSDGASIHGYYNLKFIGSEMQHVELAYTDNYTGEYYVDGKACSRDEFASFDQSQYGKKDVEWTKLNSATTTQPTKGTPYLQQLFAGESIYDGPGYEYEFVSDLESDGTFTIVELEYDSEGNLWGKLKSGVGWVDLTYYD